MATRFEEFCKRGEQLHGDKFRPPKGDAFIDAYNKGPNFRIKVRTVYGKGEVEERWGYVGLTTGWVPCFLLMRSTRSRGSSDTLERGRDAVVDCKWIKERTR